VTARDEFEDRRRHWHDRSSDGVWKWVAGIVAASLIGLLTGQFLPNRNVVTNDQLNNATKVLADGQIAQQAQIQRLTEQVANLNGKLEREGIVPKNMP
jgi:hypothetical protein